MAKSGKRGIGETKEQPDPPRHAPLRSIRMNTGAENFGNFTRAEKTAKMVFAELESRPVILFSNMYDAG
jgi:hypothetical protein